MSEIKELRLGPLPKTESIKLTFACPVSLKADLDLDLDRYACAACSDLRRSSGCRDADTAHAGSVHGR